MKCNKCSSVDVIENQALGKKFWYCRTCKEEVVTLHANCRHLFDFKKDKCKLCGIGAGEYANSILQNSEELNLDKLTVDLQDLDFWTDASYYCQGGPKTNLCDCITCREAYL